MQFIQKFLADQLWRGVFHTVDYPVPHHKSRSKTILLLEPIGQDIRYRLMIGDGETQTGMRLPIRVVKRQIRPVQTYTVNLSIKPALQRFFNLIKRKLDARRAAVDYQEARQISFHGSQFS